MPGYEAHRWLANKVGVIVGGALAFVTFVGTFDVPNTLLIGIVAHQATVVGGVAPDIDLSQSESTLEYGSVPYRQLVRLVRFLVAILLLLATWTVFRGEISVARIFGWIGMASVGIVLIRTVPDILHRIMPSHRGLTHELPFWSIMSLGGIWVLRELLLTLDAPDFAVTYLPLAVGVPIFFGVVTHVSLDVMNSYVQAHAPRPLKRRATQTAPWIPKYKPVIVDTPRLAKISVDKSAPLSIRLFVLVTAVYGVLPLDLITDALVGVGWIDDFSIYLALRNTVYSGYRREEGVVETVQRQLSTIVKVYIPIILLTLVILVASLIFIIL